MNYLHVFNGLWSFMNSTLQEHGKEFVNMDPGELIRMKTWTVMSILQQLQRSTSKHKI